MGGCRCSYKNCANTTKTRENLHFFHYPVKQKERCRQWIERAEKPQFYDLDEDQLRNKVICETHFEDSNFPNLQKKRLLQGAIPSLDGDCSLRPEKVQRVTKQQEVQVRPASDDGTIFVLETNLQAGPQSEQIETYFYTHNGLMLPLSKKEEVPSASSEDEDSPMLLSQRPTVPLASTPKATNVNITSNVLSTQNSCTPVSVSVDSQRFESPRFDSPRCDEVEPVYKDRGYFFEDPSLAHYYSNKINKNAKDIAYLKKILKTKQRSRRPTNSIVLKVLKDQIPSSLHNLVHAALHRNYEYTKEELVFYSEVYKASPDVYSLLKDKFHWKLPALEVDKTENNGHLDNKD